jgi:hypothetical protein
MDYKQLLKILTEWSIKNKEYSLTLFIYSNFNIGIPVKFLYFLPDKDYFTLSSFLNNNDVKQHKDNYLNELISLFKKSKYQKLDAWNLYGYSKKIEN